MKRKVPEGKRNDKKPEEARSTVHQKIETPKRKMTSAEKGGTKCTSSLYCVSTASKLLVAACRLQLNLTDTEK